MWYRATLKVLGSSAVMGISGWFRLYIAFLLAGAIPDLILCFAFAFVVYSVYTLDRALKSKEDELNRPEERNSDKKIILFVVFSFLSAAVLLLLIRKVSPGAALIPFIIGFLYTKGIKICSVSIKFKQGRGIKNFVVAFTWGFTIAAFIFNFIEDYLYDFLIFIFFFFKSFINTIIFDFKDVKGDSLAGMATIPVYFGEKRARIILQILNTSLHLGIVAFVLYGVVRFDAVILLYSWAGGLIYILLYANQKQTIYRGLIVHGEWGHMLAFRNLASQLSRNAFYSS